MGWCRKMSVLTCPSASHVNRALTYYTFFPVTCEPKVEGLIINIVNTINIITASSAAAVVTAQWTETVARTEQLQRLCQSIKRTK